MIDPLNLVGKNDYTTFRFFIVFQALVHPSPAPSPQEHSTLTLQHVAKTTRKHGRPQALRHRPERGQQSAQRARSWQIRRQHACGHAAAAAGSSRSIVLVVLPLLLSTAAVETTTCPEE